MDDSLKVISTSSGAVLLSIWAYLPDALTVSILVANLIYVLVKIRSEWRKSNK
tara:strand:+ start:1588 stop:1746 length:159 start_codon:yes stop_codon:yes gene_type:complete